MDINNIKKEIENLIGKEVLLDEPMSKHTSFKIGGKADLFVKAETVEEIMKIKDYALQNSIPLTIVGNGSNLLVKDNGIRGIVLKVCNQEYKIEEKDDVIYVTVGAGMPIGKLAQVLLKNEITGFEFAAGIPGTIGGAIKMNAGAYGGEFKDIVVASKYIDEKNEIKAITNKEHCFEYRKSRFSGKTDIIIETTLALKKGNYKEIKEKMDTYFNSRMEKQPIQVPNAGSTFKRGEDFITAKLIDEAGLKGYKIGGAQVSEKHAGFVVNTGNATAEDVIKLTEHIKKVVFEKFGKEIKLEIEIVGQ